METKNFSFFLKSLLSVSLIWGLLACTPQLRVRDSNEKGAASPFEESEDSPAVLIDDGSAPEDASSDEPVENAEPTESVRRTPKVAIVLGPGGVKALAHAGVLKEFDRQKIPVDYIVGLEWGALVGALYAQNGQIHETEWQLYKMEQKDVLSDGLFSSKLEPETIDRMSAFLEKSFASQRLSQTKIPFACPSLSIWSGKLVWQRRGSLKKAVSRCLPYPPIFRPKTPWMASPFSLQETVNFLNREGIEVIVFVNVLGQGVLFDKKEMINRYEASLLWQEVKRQISEKSTLMTEVVEVQTRAFKMFDFKNRKAVVKAGEQAGKLAAEKLIKKYNF